MVGFVCKNAKIRIFRSVYLHSVSPTRPIHTQDEGRRSLRYSLPSLHFPFIRGVLSLLCFHTQSLFLCYSVIRITTSASLERRHYLHNLHVQYMI